MFYVLTEGKNGGPIGVGLLGHSGLGRHWPVILPPSKAGGGRCSVKPASRSLLRSKSARTTSLRSSPNFQLPTWNGQVSR
ncbi:hypothetical protein Bca52824_017301 [Brassica carinata]|uniref:Uncharacterized protein n=1 Tax=Brassica carinata TaxID=52824 RepID=A0A8X7VMY5_BRACI|nr:hypothetical protein Bca52824_017301 [Brassica carinata]